MSATNAPTSKLHYREKRNCEKIITKRTITKNNKNDQTQPRSQSTIKNPLIKNASLNKSDSCFKVRQKVQYKPTKSHQPITFW